MSAAAAQGSIVNMFAGPHPEIREGLSGLWFLHMEGINSRKDNTLTCQSMECTYNLILLFIGRKKVFFFFYVCWKSRQIRVQNTHLVNTEDVMMQCFTAIIITAIGESVFPWLIWNCMTDHNNYYYSHTSWPPLELAWLKQCVYVSACVCVWSVSGRQEDTGLEEEEPTLVLIQVWPFSMQ